MVRSLFRILRLFVTAPFFELLGASLIVAGVWGLAGMWWGLIAAGSLALVKSLDLALAES